MSSHMHSRARMRWISLVLFLSFSLILPIASLPVAGYDEDTDWSLNGPLVEDLLIKIIPDYDVKVTALTTGEIDLMDRPLYPDLIPKWDRPDFVLYQYDEFRFCSIELNHRKWPTSSLYFRRALAHLVDKDLLVKHVLNGFGMPIDSMVPPIYGKWSNPDIMVYEYDPKYARELINLEMKAMGAKLVDGKWMYDGLLHFEPVTLKFVISVEEERREIEDILASALEEVGFTVIRAYSDPIEAIEAVYGNDWHLYTSEMRPGRDPNYLWSMWSSDGWGNYGGFHNESFDHWSWYNAWGSTFNEVFEGTMKAQEVMAEQVATIPLYSLVSVAVASGNWEGWINMSGTGPMNKWSLLNVHPKDKPFGGTLRLGFGSDIESLNPTTAQGVSDWFVLNLIYESIPYITHPSDLSDIPWTASWTSEEYNYKGKKALKYTFNMVEGMIFHDGTPVTSSDVKFTYEYMKEQQMPRYKSRMNHVVNVTAPDDYTVVVYTDMSSYWTLHQISNIILPKHIWEAVGDDWETYDPWAEGALIGSGPFMLVKWVPGKYLLMKATYTLFIRVRDEENNPIEDASIYLDGELVGEPNVEGELNVHGVTEGTHTILVTREDYQNEEVTVNVTSDMSVTVPLKPRVSTIIIYVIAGAIGVVGVYVVISQFMKPPLIRAQTDLEKMITKLRSENYIDAFKKLDSTSKSIKDAVHSGKLIEEISEELDFISESLKIIKERLLDSYSKETIGNLIARAIAYFLGIKCVLGALENIEVWKERMNKEWRREEESSAQYCVPYISNDPPARTFEEVVSRDCAKTKEFWYIWPPEDYEPIKLTFENENVIKALYRLHWKHLTIDKPYLDKKNRIEVFFPPYFHTPWIRRSKEDVIFFILIECFNASARKYDVIYDKAIDEYYTSEGIKDRHPPPVYYEGWEE